MAPNYFALDQDGNLALTSSVSRDFISDMHARGVTVVPYLTNDWSRSVGKAALDNREALARDLADAVVLYDRAGVNIDIENVTSAEREAYVDFTRLLRGLLPEGRTIAVSVAANPWGLDTGWQGSYDYAGLSEYCDYLMIMAYDEHYYGGPAGPVSSLSFIDKSLKYAVSVVPKEKIVLGLPFYGRIWSDNGGHPNGYGVSNTMIAQLIRNYGGSVYIDPVSRSARAVITVGETDANPVIGGQALAAGTYTIWYESESASSRLELVSEYGIKGTGSGSLADPTARGTIQTLAQRLHVRGYRDELGTKTYSSLSQSLVTDTARQLLSRRAAHAGAGHRILVRRLASRGLDPIQLRRLRGYWAQRIRNGQEA